MINLKPYKVDQYGIKNWNNGFLLTIPVVFLAALIGIGGYIIGSHELGAEGATISNGIHAYWMAWMAASTVGFGDVYPVTIPGYIAVGIISMFGICTFSAIGAFVASIVFSKFDTEVENRELRKQNAEIIESNNLCVKYLKEVIRTNLLSVDIGQKNKLLNEDILRTNIESVDGNKAILAELKREEFDLG